MSLNPIDINYSQNDEQELILFYFHERHPSKFLDIGGFDPKALSNTRCLVERHWSGVYVEPSPICMANFMKEYLDNPRIQLVEKAVSNTPGEITFFESGGDAVSTSNIKHRDKWSPFVKYTEIKVPTITMEDLINQYGEGVELLSLDVESQNYELFMQIPSYFWDQINMCVIEHDGYDGEMTSMLQWFGFSKLGQNAENIIMGKI